MQIFLNAFKPKNSKEFFFEMYNSMEHSDKRRSDLMKEGAEFLTYMNVKDTGEIKEVGRRFNGKEYVGKIHSLK